MTETTADIIAKSRHAAAKARPWQGAASLAEVDDLLVAGGERREDDRFDGRLANERGFWVRVPGTSVYRAPPRGCVVDEPDDTEKAWKLAELRLLVGLAVT